jgi:rRNA maturation RNase YbeY
MITISVYKQGNYPVNTKKVKDVITKTLEDNGIVSDAVVDVAIVNKAKMDELNEKYYKDEVYEHPIFTFTEGSGNDFILPPDGKLHLGQIVISYPYILEESNEKGKLIDDVACELATHGAMHLVGIHHD